jgi:hypothetical protein
VAYVCLYRQQWAGGLNLLQLCAAGPFYFGAFGRGASMDEQPDAPMDLRLLLVRDARINAAAQEILQAYLAANDPVATLYIELDRLRKTGDWFELELKRLEVLLLESAKQINKDRAAAGGEAAD